MSQTFLLFFLAGDCVLFFLGDRTLSDFFTYKNTMNYIHRVSLHSNQYIYLSLGMIMLRLDQHPLEYLVNTILTPHQLLTPGNYLRKLYKKYQPDYTRLIDMTHSLEHMILRLRSYIAIGHDTIYPSFYCRLPHNVLMT